MAANGFAPMNADIKMSHTILLSQKQFITFTYAVVVVASPELVRCGNYRPPPLQTLPRCLVSPCDNTELLEL